MQNIGEPLICPHCHNDDKSLLEAIELEVMVDSMKVRAIRYFCNNCAKEFDINGNKNEVKEKES